MPIGVGTILNYGMNAVDVTSTYTDSRKQGHGVARSIGAVAVDQALWTVAPALMWAKMGVDIAGAVGGAALQYGRTNGQVFADQQKRMYGKSFGGNYVDTQQAYTMRQRGVQALQRSGQNVNSVFGNEARTYFRGVY